jgi:plastocyanin
LSLPSRKSLSNPKNQHPSILPTMYTSALLLSLLPVALAQYGDGGTAPPPSSAAAAAASSSPTATVPVIAATITVGTSAGLPGFSPQNVTAKVGEAVEFVFNPSTHSIIQTSFDSPCNYTNSSGFFSGPVTTSGGLNTNVFLVTVNDTNPIWFYCGFPTHCEAGMVGSINAL